MIDGPTAELLSRLLDGDLDAGGRARLEARLGSEPELRAELEALRRLQAATRAVAERMDPPEALGAMLEPLRNGTPHAPRRIHPAVRWLGMAAGVVLAVTVAMEVARKSPDTAVHPQPRGATPAPAPEKSEIYQLQPLPTSPVPPEEELLGVAERLLASPPAEPDLDEPEPLYVQGPLPLADNEPGLETRDEGTAGTAREGQTEPGDRDLSRPPEAAKQFAAAPAALDARASGKERGRAARTTRLVLRSSDGVTVGRVVIDEPWPEDQPPVEVTVSGGVIVAVATADRDPDRSVNAEAPSALLLGVAADGVPDGRYFVNQAAGSGE